VVDTRWFFGTSYCIATTDTIFKVEVRGAGGGGRGKERIFCRGIKHV
jgi:hypothetical protein